ncbi:MAG: Rab family GTPase [Bacteroidota bacterium]
MKRISKKIAILGSHAVGKTSLISRFVEKKFPEKYLTTIGLKVDKKTVEIEDHIIDMVIWDIAGQEDMSKIPPYYLNGCSGYIFVVDVSRPATYEQLGTQIPMLKSMLPNAAYVIAANKMDLMSEEELTTLLASFSEPADMATSAKTGNQVDELFLRLGAKMLES